MARTMESIMKGKARCGSCGRLTGKKEHICPDGNWNKGMRGYINTGSYKKGHTHTQEALRKNRLAHLGKNAGENHWQWKGGITPLNNKLRSTPEYKNWRWNVFVRDNFTCQICGIKGAKLRANHIKKFSDYPDLRLILTNGITICEKCDMTFVYRNEEQWESYFVFNLKTRNIISDNFIERTIYG